MTQRKDLATKRTVDFVRNVAALEGKPDLAQGIIDKATVDPAKSHTVPQTIADMVSGKADAGVVYFSAAVADKDKLEILRFPAMVNFSSEIRNAATMPATAKDPATAVKFVRLLISGDGNVLLEATYGTAPRRAAHLQRQRAGGTEIIFPAPRPFTGAGCPYFPFLLLPDLRFPIRNGVGVMTKSQIHLYQRYAFRIAITPVLGFNPY